MSLLDGVGQSSDAADRAVDDGPRRDGSEVLDDLPCHHRKVIEPLVHRSSPRSRIRSGPVTRSATSPPDSHACRTVFSPSALGRKRAEWGLLPCRPEDWWWAGLRSHLSKVFVAVFVGVAGGSYGGALALLLAAVADIAAAVAELAASAA